MAECVYERGGADDDQALGWYVVRSATRMEAQANQDLLDLGFTVFLPVEVRWTHPLRSLKRVRKERPLLPGYLFVLAREGDLGLVAGAEHVSQIVSIPTEMGPRPMAVPMKHVIKFQAEVREGVHDHTLVKRPPYRPTEGARVRIVAGTWMTFFARVLSTPSGEKAQVMIEGPHGRGASVMVKHLSAA